MGIERILIGNPRIKQREEKFTLLGDGNIDFTNCPSNFMARLFTHNYGSAVTSLDYKMEKNDRKMFIDQLSSLSLRKIVFANQSFNDSTSKYLAAKGIEILDNNEISKMLGLKNNFSKPGKILIYAADKIDADKFSQRIYSMFGNNYLKVTKDIESELSKSSYDILIDTAKVYDKRDTEERVDRLEDAVNKPKIISPRKKDILLGDVIKIVQAYYVLGYLRVNRKVK